MGIKRKGNPRYTKRADGIYVLSGSAAAGESNSSINDIYSDIKSSTSESSPSPKSEMYPTKDIPLTVVASDEMSEYRIHAQGCNAIKADQNALNRRYGGGAEITDFGNYGEFADTYALDEVEEELGWGAVKQANNMINDNSVCACCRK